MVLVSGQVGPTDELLLVVAFLVHLFEFSVDLLLLLQKEVHTAGHLLILWLLHLFLGQDVHHLTVTPFSMFLYL